jgi:muramoyltetrapeptide carboxypeptidase
MRRTVTATSSERFLRPPALRAGDRVALVSPAGPSPPERIDAAIARCLAFGLEPVVAPHARARRGFLAGTDSERLADLNSALRDPQVAAVWAVRGGYGTMRLLERIDPAPLLTAPRAIIGFSDNTAVHLLLARHRLVSFHGPHAGGAFPDFTVDAFRRVLCTTEPAGVLPFDPTADGPSTLRGGVAEGRLVGGNLALLAATCGMPVQLNGRGAIVVIEDVNEPAYRIDRALTQLRLAGCLEGAAGIAFGRFSSSPDEIGSSPVQDGDVPVIDVLSDRVRDLDIPVVVGLPFGHVDRQWTVPLGVRARLDADRCTIEILEPAVT